MNCTKPDSGQGTLGVLKEGVSTSSAVLAIVSTIYDTGNGCSQCLMNTHVPDTLENSVYILVPHNSVVCFCEGSKMWAEASLNTHSLMINDALRRIWKNT